MKLLLFILSFYTFATHGQKKLDLESFHLLARPDSVVISTPDGIIYVTTDSNSKLYSWIVPKVETKFASAYSTLLESFKKQNPQPVKKHKIKNFPKSWNSVYSYKGKYYLYSPPDWSSNSGFYISESVIYITSSDPSDLYVITDCTVTSKFEASFNVVNYFGDAKHISIKAIKPEIGIYSWQIFDDNNNEEAQFIMQNSDLVKKLPMIVCDCGEKKCDLEFDFTN